MFTAIDSTGYDKGPLLNNQIQVSLFFVSFVVVFTFFFLNIFVALIILTFQEQGESEEGDCELDRNQVIVFYAFLDFKFYCNPFFFGFILFLINSFKSNFIEFRGDVYKLQWNLNQENDLCQKIQIAYNTSCGFLLILSHLNTL